MRESGQNLSPTSQQQYVVHIAPIGAKNAWYSGIFSVVSGYAQQTCGSLLRRPAFYSCVALQCARIPAHSSGRPVAGLTTPKPAQTFAYKPHDNISRSYASLQVFVDQFW